MNRANRYWLKCKELESAIERVREMHKPSTGTMRSDTYCVTCSDPYPCPTIEALDGEVK